MKKVFFTLIAATISMVASAQMYVGGSLGVSSIHDGDADETSTFVEILPEVGYNFTDRWAVGGIIQYRLSDHSYYDLTFMPYVRYTAVKYKNVNLFVDGSVGFGFGKNKKTDKDGTFWDLGLRPGVAVNLNENLSFVAHLGSFGYESSKVDDQKRDSGWGAGIDLSKITFGLYFNF